MSISTLVLPASKSGGVRDSAAPSFLAGRGADHREDLMVYVTPDDLDRLARRECRCRAIGIDGPRHTESTTRRFD